MFPNMTQRVHLGAAMKLLIKMIYYRLVAMSPESHHQFRDSIRIPSCVPTVTYLPRYAQAPR